MGRSRGEVQVPVGVSGSGVDVIDRAAAILFAFRPEDRQLTLTEISTRTGLYKSTVLRLAAALCHHRFLIRFDDGFYQLGSAPLGLGATYQANLNLGDVLLPSMRTLNAELGETVSFHIREGDHRICLYRIETRFSIRPDVRQGDVQSLERGAGGRVLSAFSGAPGALYDEVRANYSFISVGDRDPETSGISVPVFGGQQRLTGALGIVGPSSRLDRAEMTKFRPRLLHFAAVVTDLLGGDATPLRLAARAAAGAPQVAQSGP
jgi:DNA-binding IclR family transcriptional regulator